MPDDLCNTLTYEALTPNTRLSYEDLKQRFADGKRVNPETGRLNNIFEPMENTADVSNRFGPEAAEAVERYSQQAGIETEDAMRILNIHGEAGVDFLGKYANGVDPVTAAQESGIPQDWVEGTRLMTEDGDVVIGLRDTNPKLEELRGDVLPKVTV